MNCRTIIAFVTGAIVVAAPDATARAQGTPVDSGAGPAFMSARFASQGAHTFYGGYRIRRALAFIGLVVNPRTQYREAIVGLASTFQARPGVSFLGGIGLADATDAPYSQLYLLPSVRIGRYLLDGTIEGYLPISSRGASQVGTTPINLLVQASPRVALGVSYVLGAQRGASPSHAFGPSARFRIPAGSLSLDLLKGVGRVPNEFRLTAQVSY